ncbi:MAG: bifunctional oligoribonuclease/PAP phosphatase NrnA [Oscillospiraceae bacterium]|nr:bifunctional oligoribonuclease/PAP phosphatase NrnA [Oscillospiraceae bacterium]
MKVSLNQTVESLTGAQNILIIAHKDPDGDTVGAAFALYYALRSLDKHVRIACHDPIPEKYDAITSGYTKEDFTPEFVIAVDVADIQLFGESLKQYEDKVDLCIDHHVSNKLYASQTYLSTSAAATCEALYELLIRMNVKIDKKIADCLYTGIVTDTGCFKFTSTTANTHIVAARLFECGANYDMINREMFDNKSKSRLLLESMVLKAIEFYFGDRCALIVITKEMVDKTGADQTVFDGISGVTKQIEGVDVGITIRQVQGSEYRVSFRTSERVSAFELAAAFDGGGHVRAAGCIINGEILEVKEKLLEKTGEKLKPYLK